MPKQTMIDRDKLKELLKQAQDKYFELCSEYARDSEGKTIESFEDFCADHLLANGVIVPPCKVGQTVYSFCDVFGVVLPYVIQDFKVGFMGKDRPNYWYWEATSHATETDELLDEIDFDLDNIGKTVFLTREEAERKLKEREKV